MFGQMEVPQVFEHRGRWYMMFCTAAEHWSEAYEAFNPQSPVGGSHYLMADDPRGPWEVAPGPFFEGHPPTRRYAGKIIDTGAGLVAMGFIHTTPEGDFVGEVSDPIPVSLDAKGLLHAHAEWRNIPVVIVTAMELTPAEHEWLNGSVVRILQKGAYGQQDLLAEVRTLLAASIGRRKGTNT